MRDIDWANYSFHLVRRRIKETGEKWDVAVEQLRESIDRVKKSIEDQPAGWESVWTEPCEPSLTPEEREWMRSRDPGVPELLRVFPPGCLVEARPGAIVLVPAPTCRGIVVGYSSGDGVPRLTVSCGPRAGYTAHVLASDLFAVGYHFGRTPQWVASVLDATA